MRTKITAEKLAEQIWTYLKTGKNKPKRKTGQAILFNAALHLCLKKCKTEADTDGVLAIFCAYNSLTCLPCTPSPSGSEANKRKVA